MTEASTILNPWIFLTERSGSTTPQLAPLGDIEEVPTGCNPDTVIFRSCLSISASVVTLVNGSIMPVMTSRKTGALENLRAALKPSRAATMSNSAVKNPKSIMGSANGSFDPMDIVPPQAFLNFPPEFMQVDLRDAGLTRRTVMIYAAGENFKPHYYMSPIL